MDIDRFWKLVDSARNVAGRDVDSRPDALREALADLSAEQLQEFQNVYDEMLRLSYRWDLWGAAYLMNGGCSDDGFRYFRDWLISEGRQVFEDALALPDSLAKLGRVEMAELEEFGYVALGLFEELGDGELERDFSTDFDSEPAGEQWEDEDLPRLLPRLHATYGG